MSLMEWHILKMWWCALTYVSLVEWNVLEM